MAKRQTYSTAVAAQIKDMIKRRKLKPGDRIPTEAELCVQYGVSRTVVREAIMQLRSEGALVARHGIGVFVGEGAVPGFAVDWKALRTLPQTLMLHELRMAVEIESAGLCAARRSKSDATEIRRLMEMFDARHQDPKLADVLYDFRFHLAIAEASKNPYIHQLLNYMAPLIMPRVKLGALVAEGTAEAYYEKIHGEHERIVAAIEAGDSATARAAMRKHIEASNARLRKLASTLPKHAFEEASFSAPGIAASLVKNIAAGPAPRRGQRRA